MSNCVHVPLQGSDVFLEMLASCLHPYLDIGPEGKQHHWDIQEAASCCVSKRTKMERLQNSKIMHILIDSELSR